MTVAQHGILRLALLLVTGCGGGLRTAPSGLPTERSQASVVDFPPPPARPESVGPDPGPPCVWVDGHYKWDGRRWRWSSGGWLVPPEGCALSRAVLAWMPAEAGSALYYWAPSWFRQTGEAGSPCDPPQPCGPAKAGDNAPDTGR